jgi:hypothetical protein
VARREIAGSGGNVLVEARTCPASRATVGRPPPPEVATVDNWVLAAIVAVLTLFVAPVWPWSRGWTWAPAGMFAMGLATVLLFTFAVVPE